MTDYQDATRDQIRLVQQGLLKVGRLRFEHPDREESIRRREKPYERLLETLYVRDLPLAKLGDESDLLIHVKGPGASTPTREALMTKWPVEIDPVFGCELWCGQVNDHGRPIVWQPKPRYAYQIAYERDVGAVPFGLVLDHLCRRILCVNARHLEPVDKNENERRKAWAYRCKRARCAKGHDLSTALVTPEMGRLCRTCHLENDDRL